MKQRMRGKGKMLCPAECRVTGDRGCNEGEDCLRSQETGRVGISGNVPLKDLKTAVRCSGCAFYSSDRLGPWRRPLDPAVVAAGNVSGFRARGSTPTRRLHRNPCNTQHRAPGQPGRSYFSRGADTRPLIAGWSRPWSLTTHDAQQAEGVARRNGCESTSDD